uniref:Olfactory receptor Or62 n=1 Tax=Anopheles arabiensis TaxID=7173 RepID=A0A8F5XWX8_ANOAR|nr:olfactory receptor Or62 [Anopheles arabiensis]QXO34003.1 olfactory receptor Or62 [Anopheles arabiensis]
MVRSQPFRLSLVRKYWDKYFTFTDTVDYFNLLNTFGTLFALHYHTRQPRWTVKKLLWTVYRTLYLLSYLSYCYKVYWLFSHWQYSTAAANLLGALGLCSGALLRLLLIEQNYPTVHRLQQFLNDRTYLHDDPWARTERSKLYRHNNRFLVVLISAISVESLCFLARLLLTRPEFMLQYGGAVLGGPSVQLAYGMVTACWGIIYVLSFIVFYTLLAGFRLEMQLLARSFQQLEETLVPAGVGMDDQDEWEYWDNLQQRLNHRIKRHVELLENLRIFRSIVAPFAFLQYYSTFGLIADSFFVVSFEGFTGYSMAYVLFASFLILESLLLCRGVEDLNDLNRQIGTILYNFDWPRLLRFSIHYRSQYFSVRRTILLVILQSQQSLRFSYGAHGEISMHSFAELMQKSYSMLTFMLQFQN